MDNTPDLRRVGDRRVASRAIFLLTRFPILVIMNACRQNKKVVVRLKKAGKAKVPKKTRESNQGSRRRAACKKR